MQRTGKPKEMPLVEKAPSDPRAELFERLLAAHIEVVWDTARRFCWDPMDIEDIAQEAVLRAWRNFGRYEEGTNFGGWIRVVTRHSGIDYVRRMKRHDRSAADDPALLDDQSPLGDQRISLGELVCTRLDLQRALATLSDGERAMLIMAVVDGYTMAELGRLFEIPEGTVKKRLWNTRRKLRAALAGGGDAPGGSL
ncbi:MAG TPA: hypothetical protein DCZ72_01165 [Armatimonadetes bacterium]|nr:hypothetical protein [Armatimonadota bacterium]